MSTNLTVLEAAENLPASLGTDLAAAIDLAHAEKATSTRKAYGSDFRLFRAWCDAKGVSALPAAAETVAAYLAAEVKAATVDPWETCCSDPLRAQTGGTSASDRCRGRQGHDARHPADPWKRQGAQSAGGGGKDVGHGCHGSR
jgi:hypothetical protein